MAVPRSFDPRYAWLPFLGVAGVFLTVAFVLVNPSNAAALPVLPRTLFWALHVFPALALLQVAQAGLMAVPGYGRGSMWLWVAASGVFGAILFTPWALRLDALFGLGDVETPGDTETFWTEYANLAPILVVVWTALNAVRMLRLQGPLSANAPATSDVPPTVDPPAFWTKVPAGLGPELVSLSAELHYVRVRTMVGSDLILYPFGSALSDLADVDGMQVHRSHWVSLAHVTRVERVGQRATCILATGDSVPVSRAYRAQLEAEIARRRSLRA